METNIENSTIESPIIISYGGFWERFGAILLDGLAHGIITIPLTWFNLFTWKSQMVNVIISVIIICYKPFLEYKWGTTLGKLALDLKVVNIDLQKPNGTEILKRNSFFIASSIIGFIATYIMFNNPDFQYVTTFSDYMQFSKENRETFTTIFSTLIGILILIDVCFLIDDVQKKTLHDRMAKTFVIRRK